MSRIQKSLFASFSSEKEVLALSWIKIAAPQPPEWLLE
jgi:hypothetical protein